MGDVVDAEEISATWLTEVLGTEVRTVALDQVGAGQTGATFRLTFDAPDLPETMIAKVAAGDDAARAQVVMAYRNEVGFAIVALGLHGPLRYSELSRRIEGVSQKMLTQTLRNLERDGLVTRTVTPSVPVRTDYELTVLGESLLGLLRLLKEWAEEHMPEVDHARADYDARTAL